MFAIYVISPHLRDCWLPEIVMCVISAQHPSLAQFPTIPNLNQARSMVQVQVQKISKKLVVMDSKIPE